MNAKYKSRRFWISLWAIAMATFCMIFSFLNKYEPSWLATTLPMLLSVILAFVGIESWKKPRGPHE